MQKYTKVVWNSNNVTAKKYGIRSTTRQTGTEHQIDAIEVYLGNNVHPKEGAVVKQEG